MRLKMLKQLLGEYTIEVPQETVLNQNIYQVTCTDTINCVCFHFSESFPSQPLNLISTEHHTNLATAFCADATAVLQQDYLASQRFERFLAHLAPTTAQATLDAAARQFGPSLILIDHDNQLFLSSKLAPSDTFTTDHFSSWLTAHPTLFKVTEAFQFDLTTQLVVLPLAQNHFLLATMPDKKWYPSVVQLGVLSRLGHHLSQHYLKAGQANHADNQETNIAFSNSLLTLIHSQTISNDVLRHQQISDQDYHYILRFSFKVSLSKNLRDDFLHTIATIIGEIQYCLDNTHLIIHCHTEQLLNNQSKRINNLLKLAEKYAFTVTISTPLHQIEQIANAYQECITTEAYVNTISLPAKILFFQDISLLELIDHAKGRVNLNNYIHPDIHFLLAYDQSNHTDYLNTLHVYMNNAFNTTKTAEMLTIHPNTLLYRFKKIKQLLHYDFNYGKQNLDYRMSFLILYSQNKLGLPQRYD